MTLFQRCTPPEIMGRTGAALEVLIGVPQTTAIALGAALIAVVDFRVLLGTMTTLMAAGSLYLVTRGASAPESGITDPVTAHMV